MLISETQLSADQARVLDAAIQWWRDESGQYLTIGGYAGTGKTTLISLLRRALNDSGEAVTVAFACYTGKASRVLEEKLRAAGSRRDEDYCGTVHRLIYRPLLEDDGSILGWERLNEVPYDLIIVDEASMIDADMWEDLLSFHRRIIAVGDHGQLPPVNGTFNLMADPVLRLESIHRQAADSPIVQLSVVVRETGTIPRGEFAPNVVKLDRRSTDAEQLLYDYDETWQHDTLVICGSNRTRVSLNRTLRRALGYDADEPARHDRVICLRNNWRATPHPVCNGMLGTVLTAEGGGGVYPHACRLRVQMDGEDSAYEGDVFRDGFHALKPSERWREMKPTERPDWFDFGYALTAHKAQGTEADRVVVIEEPLWHGDEWKRWLYTAVTRARRSLYIIGH